MRPILPNTSVPTISAPPETALTPRLEQLCPGLGALITTSSEWQNNAQRQIELNALETALKGIDLSPLIPRFTSRPRQLSYLAGRLCAEAALFSLTGCQHVVGQHADGAPVWPVGILGSITHDAYGAVALIAFRSTHRWLGIDIEPLLDPAACHDVHNCCLSANEQAQLASYPLTRSTAITLHFAAKEAYYKAVHPQLGGVMDFLDIELRWVNNDFQVHPSPTAQRPLPVLAIDYVQIDERILVRILE